MLSWHFGSENWSFPSQVSSGYRHFCRRTDFFLHVVRSSDDDDDDDLLDHHGLTAA